MLSRFPSVSTRSRRRFGLAVVAAVAATGLAACSTPAPETPDTETRLVIATSLDPRGLYAAVTTVQQEVNVAGQITEKLLEFNPDATEFVPKLATDWEQIDDRTVALDLRADVEFTNGEAFTAESAASSIQAMLDSPAYAYLTGTLEGVRVVDEDTIEVTSSVPTAQILNALAYGSFQYPLDYLAEVGPEQFALEPIGTGPYVLDEWRKGEAVILSANPEYWGGEPEVDEVEFRIVGDTSAQVAAALSGDVDILTSVPVGSYGQFAEGGDSELVSRPGNRIYGLMFNQDSTTPLSKTEVRQALWYAIDVETLIEQQLAGRGTPLEGQMAAPNYFGWDDSLSAYPYDPELAKEMLADAGYPDGFSITFEYPSGRYPQDRELGQAIAGQLEKVGITVEQVVLEGGAFLDALNGGTLKDMYFAGYLPAPDTHFLYKNWGSTATPSYFTTPAIDELLVEENATVDAEDRAALLHELAQLFEADPPFVPLFQTEDVYVVSSKVDGFTPRATQWLELQELSVTE